MEIKSSIKELSDVFVSMISLKELIGSHSKLDLLIRTGILPKFDCNGEYFLITDDLKSLFLLVEDKPCINNLPSFVGSILKPSHFCIASHTCLYYNSGSFASLSQFSVAFRNLFEFCLKIRCKQDQYEFRPIDYLEGTVINTSSEEVYKFVKNQIENLKNNDQIAQDKYSKSASFMGSKKLIGNFLTESISSVLPSNGIVLDLMCGSGAASAFFANRWNTYVSDSLEFCRVLGNLNGKGLKTIKAINLFNKILPIAKEHFFSLCKKMGNAISIEEKIFCSDITQDLQYKYKEFVDRFPSINKDLSWHDWKPITEISLRRRNPNINPFCLFTAYFSNVYFGLRQCAEIDSLRYAIEEICEEDRYWALGALITTVSFTASTYGGHFAQPYIKDLSKISLNQLSHLITKRSLSITYEFYTRLITFASQSENQKYQIKTIPGPWEHAIEYMEKIDLSNPILVYLDAPYKREEYSRYYHVLETLCKYNYPSCNGTGLTPHTSERFRSEFFTRDQEKLNQTFTNIISKILENNWACAWSYSSSGSANIISVIERLYKMHKCKVKSFATPVKHKSQGGAKHKEVTEYLIILSK